MSAAGERPPAPGGAAPGPGAGDPPAALTAAVGAEHVAPAGAGEAIGGARPEWVVRPGSVDEVARVVCAAAARGLVVAPLGGGAHGDLGLPPLRADLALSLARLDRVLEHEPADMTVTVAAGCTLQALDAVLAPAGQWLPLDPPRTARTTVGALVAANLSGPLRASQGTVRDLLIGVEVVGAGGERLRGGGKVVKNVAGYDVPKLHVGALGSLGAVVAATFKLRPRPAHERALAIACRGASEAVELALAVRDAVEPLWLEIAAGADLARTPELGAIAGDGDDAALVVAGIGGLAEEVDDGIARARALAEAHRCAHRAVEGAAELRATLAARIAPEDGIALRAATLPTGLDRVLELLSRPGGMRGAPALGAHAASGVARVAVRGPDAEAFARGILARARTPIEAAGGSLIVERWPAAPTAGALDARDAWGAPPGGLELMRGVKRALDPDATFPTGRLPGGL